MTSKYSRCALRIKCGDVCFCERQSLALIYLVHNGLRIRHVLEPERMPHLVREDTHEDVVTGIFINIYLPDARSTLIQSLLKFPLQSPRLIVLTHVQIELHDELIQGCRERIQSIDIVVHSCLSRIHLRHLPFERFLLLLKSLILRRGSTAPPVPRLNCGVVRGLAALICGYQAFELYLFRLHSG